MQLFPPYRWTVPPAAWVEKSGTSWPLDHLTIAAYSR